MSAQAPAAGATAIAPEPGAPTEPHAPEAEKPATSDLLAETVVEESIALEELLLSRAYLYTLFHKLLAAAPDATVLGALLGKAAAEVVDSYAADDAAMAGFGRFLEGLVARDNHAVLLDEARAEYTRLFIGPGELPACSWESPYRTSEPTLFQENTLAVRALFRAHGLEPKRVGRVPDDHVALLCAFMAQRAGVALAALRKGELAALSVELRDEAAFASAHMTNWLSTFAMALRRSKTAVLYPQLVEALAAFAQVDATFLREAAFWAEGAASPDGVCGKLGAVPGSAEAQAFETVQAALATLEAAHPFGIEDYELASVQPCAEAR